MVVSQIPSALNVAPLLLSSVPGQPSGTCRHVVHGPPFVKRDGLSSPLCAGNFGTWYLIHTRRYVIPASSQVLKQTSLAKNLLFYVLAVFFVACDFFSKMCVS